LACKNTYSVTPLGIGVPATATSTAVVVSTSTFTAIPTNTSSGPPASTSTPTNTATVTATNTATSTPNSSGGVNYSCNSDTASGVTVTRTINPSQSFVPLCNGIVLYGDKQNAQIVEYNVITNTVLQTFALPGTPGDLAMDSTNGYLYCTLDGATKIERVNLNTGAVSSITTTDIGDHLCAFNGLVFVCQGIWNTQTLTILNGNAGTRLNTVAIPDVGFPVFEASTNTLYYGVQGTSPSYLYSYAYNPATYTITQNTVNTNCGSNGEDIALSPDDTHLAFPVGSGNTTSPTYTIVDFPPTNILGSNGDWNTGAYPYSAGFSPDSQHIVAPDGPSLYVFSTANYTTTKTWATVGSYGINTIRTRFSQGGDYVFMLMGATNSTTAPASIFCSSFP